MFGQFPLATECFSVLWETINNCCSWLACDLSFRKWSTEYGQCFQEISSPFSEGQVYWQEDIVSYSKVINKVINSVF